MAFRIDSHVIRGEIDNRIKGIVQGRVWLAGMNAPMQLTLTGNACPDLAGCLLKFTNHGKSVPLAKDSLPNPVQEGAVGDLTASRKVRVFDLPFEEAYKMIKRGERPPEHMSNCLYLEWYSTFNGRVVIESVDYELEISKPEWQLTKEEEAQRFKASEEGFSDFMETLNQSLSQAEADVDYEKIDWDEIDYELFMRESDARSDKYTELLDKYGERADGDEIIDREMGWRSQSEEKDPADTEPKHLDSDWSEAENEIDLPDIQPEPTTEGVDWIRTKDGDIRHPLQHRCFKNSVALSQEVRELGLTEEQEAISKLVVQYQTTAVKLAGALNSLAYGRDQLAPAFATACLKRGLRHLHAAQKALTEVQDKKLLPPISTNRIRDELFQTREDILKLMDEFRGR